MNPESRKFLKAYFGGDLTGVYVCDSTNWQPVPAASANLNPNAGWYWCPSRLSGLSENGQRVLANAVSVHALVVDDVGTKIDPDMFEMFASTPFTMVETSAGNYQAGYPLDGVTVDEFNALRARLPWAADGADAVHWWRLPGGINQKKGFPVGSVTWGSGNLDWLPPEPRAGASKARGSDVEPAPSVDAVREILRRWIVNDWDGSDNSGMRDRYQRVVAAVKGSLPDHPEEAYEIARDWAGPYENNFDAMWDSINPPRSGWGALERMAKENGMPDTAAAAVVFDTVDVPPEEEDEEDDSDDVFVLSDHRTLPRRPWVYGKRLVRGYVSTTVAAGGVGKSSLTLVEALSMATGKDLLGVGVERMPKKPQRVYLWNGEDPREEMVLRITAACKHYGINESDLGGRLFIASGRDKPIKLVGPKGEVNERLVRRLVRKLKGKDVLVIDPLVSAHYAQENDNMAMDLVLKTIGRIAGECNLAVDIVHHTRKGNGGEASVDDARGAGAVIAAARHLRVLTPMTKEVGEKHGLRDYRSFFSVSRDAVKANMVPALDSDYWYRLVSVDLENGDPFGVDGPEDAEQVGVVEKWALTIPNVDRPDIIDKAHRLMAGSKWRHNEQTGPDWVGNPVGEALGADLTSKVSRTMVKEAVEKWIKDGWLRKVKGLRTGRHEVTYVEIGSKPDLSF